MDRLNECMVESAVLFGVYLDENDYQLFGVSTLDELSEYVYDNTCAWLEEVNK